MEDERVLKPHCFGSGCHRLFTGRYYMFQVVVAFAIALASPYLLEQICAAFNIMSSDLTDSFKVGTLYNIGILTLPSVDINSIRLNDIIAGIFSGSVTQCMISLAVVTFMIAECEHGYVNLAITKGHNRVTLFIKYCMIAVVTVFPMCIAYLAGIISSLFIMKKQSVMLLENVGDLCLTIFDQFLMVIAIAIIITSITMMIRNAKAVLIVEAGILMLPVAVKYIKIFLGSKIDIEKYVLLSRLISTVEHGNKFILGDIAMSIFTVGVFGLMGVTVFYWSKLDK